MLTKLIVSFDRLSEAEFLARAGAIVSSPANNPSFPRPWPNPAPSFEEMEQAFNAYQTAYQAALGRDTFKIAQRKDARDVLTGIFKRLANYLELVADGDATMLASTGYELRRETASSATVTTLSAPQGLTLKHGELSGVLILHAIRMPNAASYEAQIADSDPTVEANWKSEGIHVHCSHIELTGLTPGKRYSVRLRGIGIPGPGAWSDTVTLMAI
jgi:hypothetical protein